MRFYSLYAQIMRERKEYYSILERTQKNDGDCTAWLLWFLSCLQHAIEGGRSYTLRCDFIQGKILEAAGGCCFERTPEKNAESLA